MTDNNENSQSLGNHLDYISLMLNSSFSEEQQSSELSKRQLRPPKRQLQMADDDNNNNNNNNFVINIIDDDDDETSSIKKSSRSVAFTNQQEPSIIKTIIIHVYQGGVNSEQIDSFKSATREISCRYPKYHLSIKYMTCEQVRINNWSPDQFISWLLDADIHFIITHVHQGLYQLEWNLRDFYDNHLMKLTDHPGFPCGINLKCPIFTQDKFGYLGPLMSYGICNESLKLELTSDGVLSEETEQQIKEFMAKPFCETNLKFIIKKPFVTNSSCKFRTDFEGVARCYRQACYEHFNKIPYLIFQKCMDNKKEYKIVVFNKKALFVAVNNSNKGTAYSWEPHTAITRFAVEAVNALSERVPEANIHGAFVRVDIFRKQNGEFVVNEFESLEACRWCPYKSGAIDCQVSELQKIFWINEIMKFLD